MYNIKAVVGLGNPTTKYCNNRHNIGYKVIDSLTDEFGIWPYLDFFDIKFKGIIRVGYKEPILLIKPTTYMNNSGECLKLITEELNILPSNLLVVHDDIALPFGTIRLREKGSPGGHNGIKNIISELKTEQFNRLRVGVGSPKEVSILEYVLSDFNESEDVVSLIQKSKFIISNILNGIIKQPDTFI